MGSGATQLVPAASGTIGTLQVSNTLPGSDESPPQPAKLNALIVSAKREILLEILDMSDFS